MEKVVSKLAGFGVPGLVFLTKMTVISATGISGGAVITAALSSIGPAGMVGGVFTLIGSAVLVEWVSKVGIDAVYSGVVAELCKKGETKDSIILKINKYPVSKELKRKLVEYVEKA